MLTNDISTIFWDLDRIKCRLPKSNKLKISKTKSKIQNNLSM